MMAERPQRRVYHKAFLIAPDGAVSPLCARLRPRNLNLTFDTWTLLWEAVTCSRCLKLKDKEQEIKAALRAAQEASQ